MAGTLRSFSETAVSGAMETAGRWVTGDGWSWLCRADQMFSISKNEVDVEASGLTKFTGSLLRVEAAEGKVKVEKSLSRSKAKGSTSVTVGPVGSFRYL